MNVCCFRTHFCRNIEKCNGFQAPLYVQNLFCPSESCMIKLFGGGGGIHDAFEMYFSLIFILRREWNWQLNDVIKLVVCSLYVNKYFFRASLGFIRSK